MKSLIKHITVFALFFILTLAFCACDGENTESQPESIAEADVETTEKWLLSKMERNEGAWIEEYTYNEKGLIICTESETNFGDSKTTCTYDENDRVTSIVTVGDSYTVNQTFSYDNRGNLTEHKTVSEDSQVGRSEASVSYTYDTNDRVLTETYSSGVIAAYTYSSEGGYTLEKTRDGSVLSSEIYNERGLAVSWSTLQSEVIYEYTFDEKGNTLTQKTFADDELEEYFEYTYDENGNCTGKKSTYADNSTTHLIYEYDEHGNKLRTYKLEEDGTQTLVEECEYKLHSIVE